MRTCSSLLLLLLVAAVAVVYPFATSAGGYWYPIGDVNQQHVQELGGWAVAEHDKQAQDGLKFSKVVSGEEQDVAGVKYHLVVDTLGGDGKGGRYDAVLVEESSNMRRLISFSPAN